MTFKRSRRLAFATALAAASALLLPVAVAETNEPEPAVEQPADAAPGPQTWAVTPAGPDGPDGRPGFDYIVEPGQTYDDYVAVRNLGEQPLTVALYAQDAVQDGDNAFELLTPEDSGKRIAAWLTLDQTELTVPARSNVVVPFTLVVPEDAEPGDHAGGIVALSAVDESQPGASVQYRVGSRVYLRVAGPVEPAIEVNRVAGSFHTNWGVFTPAPLDFETTLVNSGNVRLTPTATVTISSLFGWWERTVPLNTFQEMLPQAAQSTAAQVEEIPPFGPLWVSVNIDSVTSRDQDLTALSHLTGGTTVVWAMPWVLLAVIGLLLVAFALAIRNLRRRRNVRLWENRIEERDRAAAEA